MPQEAGLLLSPEGQVGEVVNFPVFACKQSYMIYSPLGTTIPRSCATFGHFVRPPTRRFAHQLFMRRGAMSYVTSLYQHHPCSSLQLS